MIKQLKDKAQTRIVLSAVTSYSADYDINHGASVKDARTNLIVLSLGSAVRTLRYNTESDRDDDMKVLDDHFQCGS